MNNLNLELANQLDQARVIKKTISQLSASHPNMTVKQAYDIQKIGISLREKRGEKIVGYKMGLTSKEKQEQMHVDKPIFGTLTDAIQIQNKAKFNLADLIQAKIEPEVAFILKKELKGHVTLEQALSACSGVCAALDIIDSRYNNFKFTLTDVIADNCSAGCFVLSDEIHDPFEFDLSNLKMELLFNKKIISTGSSNNILKHPGNSLVMLAKLLFENENAAVPAGSIILCGAAMDAVTLNASDHIENKIDQLGSVYVNTVRE